MSLCPPVARAVTALPLAVNLTWMMAYCLSVSAISITDHISRYGKAMKDSEAGLGRVKKEVATRFVFSVLRT